jgi:hypothetical protein
VFFDPELALWPELWSEPVQIVCGLSHSSLSTVDRSDRQRQLSHLGEILSSEQQRVKRATAEHKCSRCGLSRAVQL